MRLLSDKFISFIFYGLHLIRTRNMSPNNYSVTETTTATAQQDEYNQSEISVINVS